MSAETVTVLGIGGAAVLLIGLVVFISRSGKGRANVKTPVGSITTDGSPRPTVSAEDIEAGGRASVIGQDEADIAAKKIKAAGDVVVGHSADGENKSPKA